MDLLDADSSGALGVRALFDLASDIYGSDITELLRADSEILKQTDVSQIVITTVSLAASRALQARQVKPSACAGFSLGEYPALAVAGVISEADALRLTLERGRIMQDVASRIQNAGMAAVLGLSPDAVDSVIKSMGRADLFAANYNSPNQTVISGTSEALDFADTAFKEAGARRVIRLKVAGPFHSPLMIEAGERFSAVLDGVRFADPALPLFSNVTGKRVSSGEEAKKCAVSHISQSVRWTAEEEGIAALVAKEAASSSQSSFNLVEVGPGKVLCGLWADSKHTGTCIPYMDALQALN